MKIVVDPPKRIANIKKHELDLDMVDLDFFGHAVILPAKKNRFLALGLLDGKAIAGLQASRARRRFR